MNRIFGSLASLLLGSAAVGSAAAGNNQAPVITSTPPGTAFAGMPYVYNATASDVDGPGATWNLLEAFHDCGGSIGPATGVFTFTPFGPTPPPSCVLAISVCDGALNELCAFQTTTLTIVPANRAPVITSAPNVSVAENQTAVITVTSSDPDGGPPMYSLIGGSDVASFSIQAASGVLTFVTAPNFEAPSDAGANNIYEVTVQVNDGSGGTAMQAIGVTVTNANDPPVITSGANVNAAENQLAVITVTSTDFDGGVPVYTRTGGADLARFAINATSGVLTFITAPNFEAPTDAGANNVYNVIVQVADGNGGAAMQAIAVTVTNVNEAPAINSAAPTTAVAGTPYTYNATRTDVDGPGQTWSLVAGTHTCGGAIGATTAVFTFTPPALPPPTCVVAVQVCDGGSPNLCATQSTTVAIAASNSAPTSSAPLSAATAEDAPLAFTGGNLLGVADADGGNLTLTLSVTNGTLTLSTLNGLVFSAGDGSADATMTFSATQASLNSALASLRYAPTADYNGAAALTFSTSDGIAPAVVKNVALTVSAVADVVNDTVSTNEDTAISFNAITGTNGASADNFEGTPTVTGVTQGANGGVSSMGNGALMYSPSNNFDGGDGFSYTVASGGVTETGAVTVNVTSINDAPTLNVIANPAAIPVGSAMQTINLSGIGMGIGDSAQALMVAAVSNNVALIPNPTVTYISPNATGSLSFTPTPGQQGSALITVTVTDNGGTANGGINTFSRSFTQAVISGTLFANGFE